MNWINSWRSGNKKNKIALQIRFGFFTIFELYFCGESCEKDCKCKRFRLIILNFGFEI